MMPEQPDDAFMDSLLAPPPLPANDALRQDLLARTARRLRWRWRTRKIVQFGLVAACFLGGMATMALIRPSDPETRIAVVNVPIEKPSPEVAVEKPLERRLSAAEMELEAEKNLVKRESARRFREAGDRYLRDEANYQAALRCYRNFLDEADENDLPVVENDTWLLTSLKNARRKETENANAIN